LKQDSTLSSAAPRTQRAFLTLAVVRRAVAEVLIGRTQTVLAVVTGNPLKDIRGAPSAVTKPFDIPRDCTGLDAILRDQHLIP
jgi:threonine synthase